MQRVRVRWDATARGAPEADARRGLDSAVLLPASMPSGDLVIHEVLADHAVDYRRQDEVLAGDVDLARNVFLRLGAEGSAVTVRRLPGWAAYPPRHDGSRLFTLLPGQIGRYQANFRFWYRGCVCDPSWVYESWVVHISNGPVKPDGFTRRAPDHDIDDRVHLYGGTARSSGRSRRRQRLHTA
jgi:hypothetical protein